MEPVDTQGDLRFLLNEWNPIGFSDLPEDEYDCLIGPLLSRLARGAGRAEISEFLWHEMQDHFGLTPTRGSVDQIASRLATWWATVREQRP